MFQLVVRYLDGGFEELHLEPNTSIGEAKAQLVRQRGLSQFHEVKLFQGSTELLDDGFIEVRVPIQATVRLNVVGSAATLPDIARMSAPAVVFDEQEEPRKVEVQAVISLSFSNILAGLRWGRDKEQRDAAMAMLEEMSTLDPEQAEALLNLDFHTETFQNLMDRCWRLGRVVGRLCDNFLALLPQLLEMLGTYNLWPLGNEAPRLRSCIAMAALAAAASGLHGEPWQPLGNEAERLHSWASRIVVEYDGRLRGHAIVLLGATGTSESMARLAALSRQWSTTAPLHQRCLEALDLAQRLFQAREQQRQQLQAAPRAVVADEQAAPTLPVEEDSRCSALLPAAPSAASSAAAAPETSESEEERRDLKRALELDEELLLRKENADIAEAILKSKSERTVKVSVLRIARNARSDELGTFFEEAPELASYRAVMEEADCPLRPPWAGGAWLFAPIAERDLLGDVVLDEKHVLVREEDADAILDAVLGAFRRFPKDKRPRLCCEPVGSLSAEFVPDSSEAAEVGSAELVEERTFLAHAQRAASSLDGRMAHSAP